MELGQGVRNRQLIGAEPLAIAGDGICDRAASTSQHLKNPFVEVQIQTLAMWFIDRGRQARLPVEGRFLCLGKGSSITRIGPTLATIDGQLFFIRTQIAVEL